MKACSRFQADLTCPARLSQFSSVYRDKDTVERDFRTIKSFVRLRPMFHYTDPKVRAHVTLCMLALLLERSLERRLALKNAPITAPACFEALAGCHLNVLEGTATGCGALRLTSAGGLGNRGGGTPVRE